MSVEGIQKRTFIGEAGNIFIYALDDLCSGEQGLAGKAHDQNFVFGAFIFLEQFPRSGYRNMCQQRQLDKRGEPEEERSAGWDNAERTKQVIQSIVLCFTAAGYQKTAGKQSVCTVFPRTLGTVTGCGG